ncbi:ribose-phosphate pyrophosphokinase [Alteraurantiacibacter aestuarii]|uniref:ribose-phosphate diphosphokinase n=1 Tax=Alteraurantiacibacter aestuarii TaxID=650004 RepID=UPI0031D35C2C
MTLAENPLLFALGANHEFAQRIAFRLGLTISPHEERDFEGGEHKTRPLVEVSGRNIFVVYSLHGEAGASANDKLVRLLFFVGALRDAGAARITIVAPYLAYSRKDRRTKPRDPVATRYVAQLMEAVSADSILTVEVHNLSAFENAFRSCRPEHIATAGCFADHIAGMAQEGEKFAVVSPDAGGNKRAELLRRMLEERLGQPVMKGLMDKHRSSDVVSGTQFVGDVAGCTAIIFDDIIASGTTILRAVDASRQAGADRVIAAAAHARFTAQSPLFGPGAPDLVLISDTIPLPAGLADKALSMIEVVEVSALVGDVIGQIVSGDSVSDLLPYG